MSLRTHFGKVTELLCGFLLTLSGCETSPDVVSFNTPELCEPKLEGLDSFTSALAACELGCLICIESTHDDRAVTYSVTRTDDCVCPAPRAHTQSGAAADAGPTQMTRLDAGSDAGTSVRSDAALPTEGDAGTGWAEASPDGCESSLDLSLSAASAQCEGKADCHVCTERVDFDNEPRRYLAHLCGCPSPYRLGD
jgi:hypothetical protein